MKNILSWITFIKKIREKNNSIKYIERRKEINL
jgi:hypothetical protein